MEEQPPARPLELADIFADFKKLIDDVKYKNKTMIDYYIYPHATPDLIAGYAPRLDALTERRADLATLSLPNMAMLLDQAHIQLADMMLQLARQVSAVIRTFQNLFIDYYDPTLRDRLPYRHIYQRSLIGEQNLEVFIGFHQRQPPRRASQLLPQPSPTSPSFCPVAIAFINGADQGKIHQCPLSECSAENKEVLQSEGGLYMWWECGLCAFRVRFHMPYSATMSIASTVQIRKHHDVKDLEYRSTWLVKCHLFHFGREEALRERERKRLALMNPNSQPSSTGKGRRSSSNVINTSGVNGKKYGCPFCFAKGTDLSKHEASFANAKDFAAHLASKHSKTLPSAFLLSKLRVGVQGQTAPVPVPGRGLVETSRWELNLP